MSSYSENEKYHIAEKYLVKKQREANGLNEQQIQWKDGCHKIPDFLLYERGRRPRPGKKDRAGIQKK